MPVARMVWGALSMTSKALTAWRRLSDAEKERRIVEAMRRLDEREARSSNPRTGADRNGPRNDHSHPRRPDGT